LPFTTHVCTDEDSGLRRTQLVNWYLEDIENEIDSEAELVERKTIVEKVIYRLIHHVCMHRHIALVCVQKSVHFHFLRFEIFRQSADHTVALRESMILGHLCQLFLPAIR